MSRYDYQFDPGDDSTAARLCRRVGHDRSVLELGCAAGAMTQVLQAHYGCTVMAVEHDGAAAEQARRSGARVIVADLDDAQWSASLGRARFQAILAADVLEHLHDPLACLQRLREHLEPGGRLHVSVPNIAHSGVLAALMCNAFPYAETGLLDRTHVHFFTAYSLGQMLAQAGFAVESHEGVDAGPEHPEFAPYWQRLPEAVRAQLAGNPAGRAYQVIVTARLADEAGPASETPDLEAVPAQQAWLDALEARLQPPPAPPAARPSLLARLSARCRRPR